MAVVVQQPGRVLFSRPLPAWKRALDVAVASIGLVVSFPILVAVGLYVKAVSPGPVLFAQTRLGYLGRPFAMLKLRTMYFGADTEPHRLHVVQLIREQGPGHAMRKLGRDPRVIPFGETLRRLGVDELPQLVNVLRGEMSLVGPRPAIPYEAEEYAQWHVGRFDAVPGITGLWQVSGKNRLSFREMVSLDIRYARERSFTLDVRILLMTLPAIVGQLLESKQKGGDHHEC
jgi:lipopolysaccharide/colanic/teichoic acid biosynthesis glycosyltransferase